MAKRLPASESVALSRRRQRDKAATGWPSWRFQGQPYVRIADGGEPRVLRARLAQSLLRRLALALPRWDDSRVSSSEDGSALEQISRRKGITEFNELFRVAYQAAVEAALDSAPAAPADVDIVSARSAHAPLPADVDRPQSDLAAFGHGELCRR